MHHHSLNKAVRDGIPILFLFPTTLFSTAVVNDSQLIKYRNLSLRKNVTRTVQINKFYESTLSSRSGN